MTDKNEVLKLAGLAHLEFSKDELEGVCGDMEKIIAFADLVNASFDGAEAEKNKNDALPYEFLRKDTAEKSVKREKILSGTESEDGMFTVKGGI